MKDECGDEVDLKFMRGWPDVSVPVNNALTAIIEAIQVLEAEHPITISYAESFVEILMNLFPSTGTGFKVNPTPIVDMVVLDEDNEEIYRVKSPKNDKVH